MNAQPEVNPEDVLQRMAREVGTVVAEKMIAESQRDAALRQVAELTQQIVEGQAHAAGLAQSADDLRAQLTEANRERAAVKNERDAVIERFELAAGPNQSGWHTQGCGLDIDHKGACVPSLDDPEPAFNNGEPAF